MLQLNRPHQYPEKDKERQTLQLRATAISPELDVCQHQLRCVVEGIEKHQILVRFTHIDASDPNCEFSLVVDVSGQIYKGQLQFVRSNKLLIFSVSKQSSLPVHRSQHFRSS